MIGGPSIVAIIQTALPFLLNVVLIVFLVTRYGNHPRAATWGIIGLVAMMLASLSWIVGARLISTWQVENAATGFGILGIVNTMINFAGICCLIRGLLIDRRMSVLSEFQGKVRSGDTNPYAAPYADPHAAPRE